MFLPLITSLKHCHQHLFEAAVVVVEIGQDSGNRFGITAVVGAVEQFERFLGRALIERLALCAQGRLATKAGK